MSHRHAWGATAIVGAAAYICFARPWHLRWGGTDQEFDEPVPGDDLIAGADLIATRAITIRTSPDRVWPWLAQLGQGRGGFYSYDFLENLVGADIHNANRIVPEWQDVRVGDQVKLFPEVGLVVASLERGRSLVLRGRILIGNAASPYDFTWAFVLREGRDATTRLLVRERYAYMRPWARLIVEPAEAVSFVMSQKTARWCDPCARAWPHSARGPASRRGPRAPDRRRRTATPQSAEPDGQIGAESGADNRERGA